MTKDKDIKTVVPPLRFPEFSDAEGWEEKTIGKTSQSFSGGTPKTSESNYYGGDIPFIRSAEINKDSTELFLTEDGLLNSAAKLVTKGDVLVALYGANSGDVAISKINGAINQAILCLKSKDCNLFLCQYLTFKKDDIISTYIQGGQGNLSGEIIKSLKILLPTPAEQEKIADCLGSLDDLIGAVADKVEVLKEHKKGLMQQLFPAEGKTTPAYRFPQFQNTPEWQSTTLGQCLNYEQPTPYLVSNTNYNDTYNTPVLTAGKSFILGYTNEIEGIYNHNLPVIIFDDFTTGTQYVDFPFKAKSSAMKILSAKSCADIKFMYELMNTISYQVAVHERHWISRFSPMVVLVPDILEQKAIADCLSSVDELIAAEIQKLDQLKAHKKGLMQQLFPTI